MTFTRLMDDRWAHLTTLVDNRVFTHRLTNRRSSTTS